MGHGAPVAFAAGVVLNILPGTFPIVALKDIAEVNASNTAKVAAIVVFYLIMFAFVEVPIVSYVFVPERTTVVVDNFNDWLTKWTPGRRVRARRRRSLSDGARHCSAALTEISQRPTSNSARAVQGDQLHAVARPHLLPRHDQYQRTLRT